MEEVEERRYGCTGVYSESGRSYVYILCPFCRERVKAYVWSLEGSGKKCGCGAKFGGRVLGIARRKKVGGK